MLNRVEVKVMGYIFDKCKGESKVLLTPKELLSSLMPKIEITAKQLEVIMSNLVLDDYIESEKGEKDGRVYYVVSLTMRGAAFDRERQSLKKSRVQSVLWKVALTVGGVVLAFVLSLILRRAFGVG